MIQIIRTDTAESDFLDLVKLLDKELLNTNGEDHLFYSQFNRLDIISHVVVAYNEGSAVACGAMKQYDSITMEIKRMYTKPSFRGKRIAGLIVTALENWAAELSYQKCILETGKRLPSAIKLYTRQGYLPIANFGQYVNSKNSICFEKKL